MNTLQQIKINWQKYLLNKDFRYSFFISAVILSFVLFWLARFLVQNETRNGFAFNDPFLSLFTPIDVTWITFILLYGALIISLTSLSFHPVRMLIAFQAYAIIAFMRLTTIYFLPLNEPATIIPLTDPFVAFFGEGRTFLRDLFFSGHTATMFLFYLTAVNKKLKIVFLILTIIVAGGVLVQHVHYTVDVIVAPFVAYAAYRISVIINKKNFS